MLGMPVSLEFSRAALAAAAVVAAASIVLTRQAPFDDHSFDKADFTT